MAEKSLPHRSSRTPRRQKHSLKGPFTGKSQPTTPSNVIRLQDVSDLSPSIVNGKVPPRRLPNKARRSREHLSEKEVGALLESAKKSGRHGHRDATLILLAYRHALRVSELVALRWDQINLSQGLLHVSRAKNGTPSTHPLRGPEIQGQRDAAVDPDTGKPPEQGPVNIIVAARQVALLLHKAHKRLEQDASVETVPSST